MMIRKGTTKTQLKTLATGLVYRNSMPHLHSRHAFFPSSVELANGELIVAMDIGSAFEAVDVRSYLCRSSDGGQTWAEPELIFTPNESAHPISTSCRIGLAANGELIGLAGLFDRQHTELGLVNPSTEGFVHTDLEILRSSNGGHLWSEGQILHPPVDWHGFEICSPIITLASGRCLWPTATWRNWQGEAPFGMKAVVFVSDDGGQTWPHMTDTINNWSDRISSWEQRIIKLSDGRLMSLCWAFDFKSQRSLRNFFAFSSDDGDSFGQSLISPLNGETCAVLALPDNHILCIYRRTDLKGLWAQVAEIEGESWTTLAEAPLWGTNVSNYGDHSERMMEQISTLKFGCPCATRLKSGEVFCAFWCIEDCISNIRWIKLEITD